MNDLRGIIDGMSVDYVKYVPHFLHYIKAHGEIDGANDEVLYAALYMMVEHDDGDAISGFLNDKMKSLIEAYEKGLLFDEKAIMDFDTKYHFGNLTPWGNAIRHFKASAILALQDHTFLCHLSKLADDWDMVVQMENPEELRDDEIMFLIDNLSLIDAEHLLHLILLNKESVAEKIVFLIDRFEFDCILSDIRRMDDKCKSIIKWTQEDLYNNIIDDQDIQKAIDKLIDITERKPNFHSSCNNRSEGIANDTGLWNCEGVIKFIQSDEDNTAISIVTDRYCYTAEICNKRSCCELFGGYIISEDDLSSFIGASLLQISLTDVACDTKIVEEINSMQNIHNSCDFHNIQFINFETSKGVLQFVVYNCHNGYYGHDVTIKCNDRVLFVSKI